jgi:hypothetical protein
MELDNIKQRRLRKLKAFFLLTLAACMFLLAFRHSDQSLLEISRQLGQTTMDEWLDYTWLSDGRCLVMRQVKDDFEADMCDVRLNRYTPVKAINQKILPLLRQFGLGWQISPDDHWVLWKCRTTDSGWCWNVSSTTNLVNLRWKASDYDCDQRIGSAQAWTQDSKHWMQLLCGEQEPRIIVHALDTPGKDRIIKLQLPEGVSVSPTSSDELTLLGVTYTGSALIAQAKKGAENPITSIVLYEAGLTTDTSHPRKYLVDLPQGVTVLDVELSGQGQQLALVLQSTKRPPLPLRLAERWFPFLHAGPARQINSMWISRIDGGAKREIGYIDAPAFSKAAIDMTAELKFGLRWARDGHHISYSYKKHLYIVRTD